MYLFVVRWVLEVVQLQEVLLDVSDGNESGQDVTGTGLVVGTGHSSTTEPLLGHDGTSGLVIDVEVTSTVSQLLLGQSDGVTVLGKDGTGQTVGGNGVDLVHDGLELAVWVCVSGQDRTEELSGQELVLRVGGLNQGWLDEVTGALVGLTALDDGQLRVGLGLLNGSGQLVEGLLVDDRTKEVLEGGGLGGVSDGDFVHGGSELLLELRPHGLRHVDSGGGRALLALVLEGTSQGGQDGVVDRGGLVDQVEVLTTGLTHDSWVVSVDILGQVGGNGAVHALEDLGGTSEVQGSKVAVIHNQVGNLDGVTGDEVDHTGRQTSLLQDGQKEVVGEHGGGRRLPHNGVTHQGRSTNQVTGNGGEVEWSHGVDETLQRSVLSSVPHTRSGLDRLLLVQLLGVLDVETQEVGQLGDTVDLSLVNVLTLAKHRGGKNVVAVLGGDQVGGLQEHSCSVGPSHLGPLGLGALTGSNGLTNVILVGLGKVGQNLRVVGWVHLLDGGSVVDFLTVDDKRNVQWRVGELGDGCTQKVPVLRVSTGKLLNRLVGERRWHFNLRKLAHRTHSNSGHWGHGTGTAATKHGRTHGAGSTGDSQHVCKGNCWEGKKKWKKSWFFFFFLPGN